MFMVYVVFSVLIVKQYGVHQRFAWYTEAVDMSSARLFLSGYLLPVCF